MVVLNQHNALFVEVKWGEDRKPRLDEARKHTEGNCRRQETPLPSGGERRKRRRLADRLQRT